MTNKQTTMIISVIASMLFSCALLRGQADEDAEGRKAVEVSRWPGKKIVSEQKVLSLPNPLPPSPDQQK